MHLEVTWVYNLFPIFQRGFIMFFKVLSVSIIYFLLLGCGSFNTMMITTHFTKVEGLVPGTDVNFNDTLVGKIESIEKTEENYRVVLKVVKNKVLSVQNNAIAVISRPISIELHNPDEKSVPIEEGAVIQGFDSHWTWAHWKTGKTLERMQDVLGDSVQSLIDDYLKQLKSESQSTLDNTNEKLGVLKDQLHQLWQQSEEKSEKFLDDLTRSLKQLLPEKESSPAKKSGII